MSHPVSLVTVSSIFPTHNLLTIVCWCINFWHCYCCWTTYIKAIRSTHKFTNDEKGTRGKYLWHSMHLTHLNTHIPQEYELQRVQTVLVSGRKTQTMVHETRTQKKIIKIISYRRNSWLNSEGNGACVCIFFYYWLVRAGKHTGAHVSLTFRRLRCRRSEDRTESRWTRI